jgi:hypothetical protein
MKPIPKHKQRDFPIMPLRDGGGRTVLKAMIICSQCADAAYHLRRGTMEPEQYFEKEGWFVGTTPAADKCPQCKKVVHMKEHKKPDAVASVAAPVEAVAERKKTGTDRVLIGMRIAESFDEAEGRYKSGCSDVQIADDVKMPVEWVSAEREHLYPGSSGDNPDTAAFVREVTILQTNHTLYEKRLEKLTASVCTSEGKFKELQELQTLIRKEQAHFGEDRDKFKAGLQRLLDLADTLPHPRLIDGRKAQL